MKKTLPIIALAGIAVLGFSIDGFTNAGGAPQGRSGGPAGNGNTCMNGCHTGGSGLSSQTITISSDIPASGFEENTDYTITVEANTNGAQGSKIGFAASVENSSGSHQGTITTADSRTQKSGANYITHRSSSITPSSGVSTWDFNWNSGTAEDGSTVYVAVNFANGNGNTAGDAIGTQTLVLDKASGVSIAENGLSEFKLFPVPATEYTTASFSLVQSSEVSYQIIDMSGNIVKSETLGQMSSGNHSFTVDLNNMTSGNYLIHVVAGNKVSAERFTLL